MVDRNENSSDVSKTEDGRPLPLKSFPVKAKILRITENLERKEVSHM